MNDHAREPLHIGRKPRLSTLPEDVAFRQLVDIAKLRWRIPRGAVLMDAGYGVHTDLRTSKRAK